MLFFYLKNIWKEGEKDAEYVVYFRNISKKIIMSDAE